ncbi:MAG: Glycosyl transferase, family 2 [Candidatus Ozemobacter sibiricus]|uniref:Glycosyl transferase, family 2 n=1 Tax=Candidatus Ozemobacter sibiricus TaxID=2268124 RepID=A0A367ZPQ9_9BACT|nr:MAG: Glycosyl transferase, family 2 [Candidatus Ozemobacter sibiricus]
MAPTPSFRLSVVIPVYNERFTLATVVEQVLRQEGKPGIAAIQIVIVDDGSTDGTRDILAELAARHPQIVPIYHQRNQGKTGAIRTGIEHADGDLILFQDADLEYDPNDYPRLLQPIVDGHADVVFGSRYLGAEYRRILPFWHSIMNWGLTSLSNMLTNLHLTDMETCYKVFRAPILKSIPLRSSGFGLEPEITAKVAKRNLRIFEVPISYRGRTYDEGKKITWKDGCWALFYMLKYWLIDDCYREPHGDVLHQVRLAPRFSAWLAELIRPFLAARVLEIGAGIGNLTSRFLPREAYFATDTEEHYLATLQSRFGHDGRVKVLRFDLAAPPPAELFVPAPDTIVCLRGLERLDDDRPALARLFEILAPGGSLILLVPQGPHLFGSLDEAVPHRRRYTRTEITARLEEAGFRLERLDDFNRPGVVGWWLYGKVWRASTLDRLPMKVYEHLVWLFRRIDRFLPWPGLSLIAVARKPASQTRP